MSQKENITLLDSSNVSEKPGQGLRGIIGKHKIRITSRKILEENPESINLLPPIAPGLECIVMIDNKYAASLHFHDAPRIESKSFLGHLAPSHQFKNYVGFWRP